MSKTKKFVFGLALSATLFIFGAVSTPKAEAAVVANPVNSVLQTQIQNLMQQIVGLMQQLKTLLTQQKQSQITKNIQNEQPPVTDLSKLTKEDAMYGWLTFASEKYDFEIKYPTAVISAPQEYGAGWHLQLPDVKSYGFAYNAYIEGQDKFGERGETQICTGSINLGIFSNDAKLSLSDWFAKYGKGFGYSNQAKQEITTNGARGIKFGALGSLPSGGGNIDGIVLISHNSLIYTVELDIDQGVIGSNQDFISRCSLSANEIFNKMVSTFKFGDNSSIGPSIEVLSEGACVRGKRCNITWTSSWISSVPNSGKVSISLVGKSTDRNVALNTGQDVLLSEGKYSWTIPSTFPAFVLYQAKVCVLNQSGGTDNMPCGLSDIFTIWEHEQ